MNKPINSMQAGPTEPLPDFILIGAMKSGTTTLHEYLRRHPGVFMCKPKEPQFFSHEAKYARGESWYRSLFAGADKSQLCGEASACYSRWPHFGDVPGRIAMHAPDAKLIYLMRHPVERAYSHYKHEMRTRRNRIISFDRALDELPEILDASLYLSQIERFLEHFPRDRMLLLTFDDLTEDPRSTLEQVQRFLGLDVVDLMSESPVKSNEAHQNLIHRRANRWQKTLKRTAWWGRVARLTPAPIRRGVVSQWRLVSQMRIWHIREIQRYEQRISPLTPQTRRQLLERLDGPTQELETLLGRDLSMWRR